MFPKLNVLLLLILPITVGAVQPLGKYNVKSNTITCSGISSGGSMATQMHVAYSNIFRGAALIAGPPYWCAKGILSVALGACMEQPEDIDVNELILKAQEYESTGQIDPLSNLANDRVYVLGGTLDTTVVQGVGMKAQQFYLSFVPENEIMTVFDLPAAHTQPTLNYGNACDVSRSPYISICNYDAAFELLNFFFGGDLVRPNGTVPLNGQFYEYDQAEFFDSTPQQSSMDAIGFVYVPSACVSGTIKCSLHVVFHGCLMQKDRIEDEFARYAGYNEVGELNDIIMLYPQACYSAYNPNGCWDWWGYTNDAYATKAGEQPLAVWKMVEKVAF